jgi:hypothetical protein
MANLAAEAANIDSMLSYIGFNAQAERTAIAQDGFESFDDLLQLKDNSIQFSMINLVLHQLNCLWKTFNPLGMKR